MENYSFSVGDYVETVDGQVGYISKIYDNLRPNEVCFDMLFTNKKEGFWYYITKDKLYKYFKRIGHYTFQFELEKENKKEYMIKPIDVITKECTIDGFEMGTCVYKVPNLEIVNKINEIIDYINKEN